MKQVKPNEDTPWSSMRGNYKNNGVKNKRNFCCFNIKTCMTKKNDFEIIIHNLLQLLLH
jgi:hypothetical protein